MSKKNFESLMQEDGAISRRNVIQAGLGLAGLGYLIGLGYPVYRYLASPVEKAKEMSLVTEVTLEGAEQLPLGSAMMFKFGASPSILLHHKDNSWTAFSAVCTHLGCTVQFEPQNERIFCACHGGSYDIHTGEPTGGPPPKGLKPYQVEVLDGKIIIKRG